MVGGFLMDIRVLHKCQGYTKFGGFCFDFTLFLGLLTFLFFKLSFFFLFIVAMSFMIKLYCKNALKKKSFQDYVRLLYMK